MTILDILQMYNFSGEPKTRVSHNSEGFALVVGEILQWNNGCREKSPL